MKYDNEIYLIVIFSKCPQARTAATFCAADADTTRTNSPEPNSAGAPSTGVVTSSATRAWSAPKNTVVNDESARDNDNTIILIIIICVRVRILRVTMKIFYCIISSK